MMTIPKVVDMREYRADQSRRRLPLFDPPDRDEPRSRPAVTLPFGPPAALSSRQVSHRVRMLEHLGSLSGVPARFRALR